MAIDHERIGEHVDELDARADAPAYDESVRSELRRTLTALEALLRLHFDKEERVYVPLLEQLTPAEATAVAEQMQAATTNHQHEHH
jgi:iron-sulfur cluster repair protein YtfE (RIC family)